MHMYVPTPPFAPTSSLSQAGHQAEEAQHRAQHEASSAEKGPTSTPAEHLRAAKHKAGDALNN